MFGINLLSYCLGIIAHTIKDLSFASVYTLVCCLSGNFGDIYPGIMSKNAGPFEEM